MNKLLLADQCHTSIYIQEVGADWSRKHASRQQKLGENGATQGVVHLRSEVYKL